MLLPSIIQLGSQTEITLAGRLPGIYFLKSYTFKCFDLDGQLGYHLFSEEALERPLDLPNQDRVVAFIKDPDGLVERNLRRWFPRISIHFFPSLPRPEENCHVAWYVARCLQRISLPVDPAEAVLGMCRHPPFKSSTARKRTKTVIFHPGSGSDKKNHPSDFWIELIKRFGDQIPSADPGIVVLLGPAEEHLYPVFSRNPWGKRVKLLISSDHRRLGSILRFAALYVGHDSGVTHLASMHGVPVIALFRNSSVKQWKPLGPNVSVIDRRRADAGLIEEIIYSAIKLGWK